MIPSREFLGINPYTKGEVWVVPGPSPSPEFLALARTGTNVPAAIDPNAPPITRSNRLRMGRSVDGAVTMTPIATGDADEMFRPAPGRKAVAYPFEDACGSAVFMADASWTPEEVARRLAIVQSLHPLSVERAA